VVREHHWQPQILSEMYLDDQDHRGVVFWYNDIVEVNKEMKTQNKK